MKTKTIYQSIMMMLVLVLCTACPGEDKPSLTVSTKEITFTNDGGTETFHIYANAEAGTWTVAADKNWINVSPQQGTNDCVITVSTKENNKIEPLEGTLTISSNAGISKITVKQEASNPIITVNNVAKAYLEYSSEKNISQTVTITSNTEWEIKSSTIPEWLHISPKNGGSGTTNVTISTKEANNSSMEREANIEVSTTDATAYINITQIGNRVKNCSITISDCVSLTNEVAFKMDFDSKVRSFYIGIIDAVDFGKLNEEDIIRIAEQNFTLYSVDEKDKVLYSGSLGFLRNLTPGTSSYIITIPYDNEKKMGDIVKEKVTTKNARTQEPMVKIGKLYYDSSYWYVNIKDKETNCFGYYAYLTEDPSLVLAPDAIYAWYINKGIREKTLEKYTGAGEDALVKLKRTAGMNSFGIGVQGYDSNDVLAGSLAYAYAEINSSYSKTKALSTKKDFNLYPLTNEGKVVVINK